MRRRPKGLGASRYRGRGARARAQVGSEIKAMVISQDKDKGRFSLSTKSLEPEPGDMLKDPAGVFSQAEAMAARYHERLQAENKAREEVPRRAR